MATVTPLAGVWVEISSTPLSSIDTWEKMASMVKFGIAQNGQAIFYCPKKKPTSDFKMKLVGGSST